MKGMDKRKRELFSNGSAILREWGIIGQLKEYMKGRERGGGVYWQSFGKFNCRGGGLIQ